MTQTRMRYKDIRAAVAIDSTGEWRVLGCSDEKDVEIIALLKEDGMENATIYWITSRVPIPQEFPAVLMLTDQSDKNAI